MHPSHITQLFFSVFWILYWWIPFCIFAWRTFYFSVFKNESVANKYMAAAYFFGIIGTIVARG